MVSHWTFAFDYWKLSYKNKLKYDKRPVETNKFVLDALNYVVCGVIVMLSASVLLTFIFGLYKSYEILDITLD
jgi:hypothetical protein